MAFTLYAIPFVDYSGVGSTIPAAFVNLVRVSLPNAIDGAGGGTYAPTAPIAITGTFGLQVITLNIPSAGTETIQSGGFFNIASGGTGTVQSGGLFNVASGGKIQVLSGGLLDVEAGATLRAEGSITIHTSGVLTVEAGCIADILGTFIADTGSFVTIASGVPVTDGGTRTITGPTTYSGNGAVRQNRHLTGADADTTYDPSQFDAIRIPQLTTADRTYTLNPPASGLHCDFELFWYVYGTDPLSTGISLGPTQGASTKDLILLSSTGSLNIRLAHNATPISAEPTARFWHGKFHYDGSDWKVMSLQHP